MIVDRARADEKLRGDLAVSRSSRREACYPRFLRCQVRFAGRDRGPPPCLLTRRAQLRGRLLGKSLGSHMHEHVVRDSQFSPGVPPPSCPAQPLTVKQVSSCEVGGHLAPRQLTDGFPVEVFGFRPARTLSSITP